MILEDVLAKFKELFGDEGEIGVYFAPGRVNMIGEHTDYNGGHVFPCALTIGTYGVARKRNDKKLRFYSMNFEQLGVIESSVEGLKPEKEADWTNYPKGVMWAFGEKGMKVEQYGSCVIWQYSKRLRTFFFCISGSSDRIYFKRYVWIRRDKSGSCADRTVL